MRALEFVLAAAGYKTRCWTFASFLCLQFSPRCFVVVVGGGVFFSAKRTSPLINVSLIFFFWAIKSDVNTTRRHPLCKGFFGNRTFCFPPPPPTTVAPHMHMERIALLRTQNGKRRHRVSAQELEFGQERHGNSVCPLMGLRGIGGAGGGGGEGGLGGRWTTGVHVHALSLPSSLFPSPLALPPSLPFPSLLPCLTAGRCAGLGRADAHTSRWRDGASDTFPAAL